MSYEHIDSFERSRKWLLYYWGFLQYALAIILSLGYHCRSKKIVREAEAAKAAKKMPLKSSALTDNEEPIVSSTTSEPIAIYQRNALV